MKESSLEESSQLFTNLCRWRKSRFNWRRNKVKLIVKVNNERVIETSENKTAVRKGRYDSSACDVAGAN